MSDLRVLAEIALTADPYDTSYGPTEFQEECTPEHYLAVLGELDRLRAIVNDLADSRPDETCCSWVESHYLVDWCEKESHDPECFYRRAVAYKESQP